MSAELPDFIRRRLDRAIQDAYHPSGMSVHDGKARVDAADIERLLKIIDQREIPTALRKASKMLREAGKPILADDVLLALHTIEDMQLYAADTSRDKENQC